MSNLRTQNRGFLTWIQPGYIDAMEDIRENGDKLTQVCLFYLSSKEDGSIYGGIGNMEAEMARAKEIADKWPHIRWLLTVKNVDDPPGEDSAKYIITNNNNEQDVFFQDLRTILNKYNWIDGIDTDFERIEENSEADIYRFFHRVYDEVKAYDSNLWVSFDLPPMTGPHETVGAEKWCAYEKFENKFDSIQIMTYDYAWAGSAPGATTPIHWFRDVLDYATSVVDPNKIYAGIAAYGFRWQIYDYPRNRLDDPENEVGFRGASGNFEVFLRWVMGGSTHTDANHDETDRQRFVPFFSYYDHEDFMQEIYLHIYDFPGGGEEDSKEHPMVGEVYDGRPFLAAYDKKQRINFENIVVDKEGTDYDAASGALDADEEIGLVRPVRPSNTRTASMQPPDPEGYAAYTFNIEKAGNYDIVMRVKYNWFDENKLHFRLNGEGFDVGDVPEWYPYNRITHWTKVLNVDLSAGLHDLELIGSQSRYLTQFYGFRVCDNFTSEYYGGEADFTVRPREFLDVNREITWPTDNEFMLTLETLRRPPESAIIWYDDFKDWQEKLPDNRYNIDSGNWEVIIEGKDPDGPGSSLPPDPSDRSYRWVEGSGEFSIKYDDFKEVEVQATIEMTEPGKAGITFSDVYYCINTKTGNLELYKGGTRLFAYASSYSVGGKYNLNMRIINNEIICYAGGGLVFSEKTSGIRNGSFGIKSDANMKTDLLRAGDAVWHYRQEAIDIVLPDGKKETLGRIPRNVRENEWGFVEITESNELNTRQQPESGLSKNIEQDWDYIHSKTFKITNPSDQPIKIRTRDIGFWLSTLYLGDADGFSIAYFQDANTILKTADIAAFEYSIRGIGMWSLGQEDPDVLNQLISHV